MRFPPPLSPAMTMLVGSTPYLSAFAWRYCTPDTQSFKPVMAHRAASASKGEQERAQSTKHQAPSTKHQQLIRWMQVL